MMTERVSGTREWSGHSMNIGVGCSNNCRYCYARAGQRRWQRENWLNWHKGFVFNPKWYDKWMKTNRAKKKGIMTPTQHDITEDNWEKMRDVILHNHGLGSRILIVSKGGRGLELLAHSLMQSTWIGNRGKIEIRISIGSTQNETLAFWEPGAPGYEIRKYDLKLAYDLDFNTSVSCEPYLSTADDLIRLIAKVRLYCTQGIWIGPLNKLNERVNFQAITAEENKRFVQPVLDNQTPESVGRIHDMIGSFCEADEWHGVHYKCEFRELLNKHQEQEA
ncbi:MAG: hypothetical protein KOO60_07285 [Gemmatimonadales bacterium]|nr:hypothetical protein [Gemmatimonadales bacterium]